MRDLNKLIAKYDVPVPRYTSYPPIPFWTNNIDEEKWVTHFKLNYKPQVGLDIYIHVPFCESLCYYCGCHRTINKNHSVEDEFVENILKEWSIYKERLGFFPSISSLHFGGGTPTFLSAKNLDKIISSIAIHRSPGFIGSIEIDPRTCKDSHIETLSNRGIKRVSLGIQDFDENVQIAINRRQSEKMVRDLVEKLRASGVESINFDLIYGLPKQSKSTLERTIEIVKDLSPDLIAFYSYAHLPERLKNQRLIKESDLLVGKDKRELFDLGRELLSSAGFCEIGMDHFAKAGNYLLESKERGDLHRSFMGYTDKKSGVLLGLGPSSISDTGFSFGQNFKDYASYKDALSDGRLPLERSHELTHDEILVQKVILDVMCLDKISTLEMPKIPHIGRISTDLEGMEEEGILKRAEDHFEITELGQMFRRNIAVLFDLHLNNKKALKVKFSQSL